jgi:RNA polymerase sigma-70 factor, ECF subfamily
MTQTEKEELAPKAPIDFESFFRDHYRRLTQGMLLLTGDRWEAEDLAQEAFTRVYHRWAQVSQTESPDGYLYRTALNLRRNRLRALAVRARRSFAGESLSYESPAVAERLDILRAVAELPAAQKEALVLVDWIGFEVSEVAELLGIEPVSVRVRLYRARKSLRERFGGEDDA